MTHKTYLLLLKFFKGLRPARQKPLELPIGHYDYDSRRALPDDIGSDGLLDYEFKNNMANSLAKSYLEWGDPMVGELLARLIDIKMCSMIAYRMAVALFEVGGASLLENRPEIEDLFNLVLSVTGGRNVVDSSFEASFILPVKYRGYGHPINSRDDLGHIFQVNISCFPPDSRLIGIKSSSEPVLNILKGMRHVEDYKIWSLFELDPTLSDDLTALFSIETMGDNRMIEICHFTGNDVDSPIIYRFSRNV